MKKVGYECRNVEKKGGGWEPGRCEGEEKGKTWRRRRGRGPPATNFEKKAGREGGEGRIGYVGNFRDVYRVTGPFVPSPTRPFQLVNTISI